MTDAYSTKDVTHAMGVLADQDDTAIIQGYYVVPQSIADGVWGVYQDTGDDPDIIDALRADRFKTALELIHYLQRLDQPGEATEGDLDAPEVA